MPQETNLNVAPYFDDFEPNSNYYRVLFKPAYPVQARELNNLQSILQNQIEDFGNHIFKEGAKVIPGQLTYNKNFYCIQIEPEFLGVPVSLYLDQLIGQYIRGQSSGVTAKVITYITDEQSERGVYTIYLEYHQSSTTDLATQTFSDNEVLVTETDITFATTFIAAGEGFAKAIAQGANAIGSSFALEDGVYFIRGFFVDVYKQLLILDQYGNTPSYRIGFRVTETTVSSDVDPTLNDNAKGFNNYTAPGADRLEITATLIKIPLDQVEDTSFIELAEVQDGFLRKFAENTEYNYLGDELARRTFDESGHYYVKEFVTSVKESLNNGFGNRGLYNPGQTTATGSTPSDDLAIYKIAPGKAYVRGYECDVRAPVFLDCPKPRTTQLLEAQGVNFAFGPTFGVNRVFGSPTLGFDSTNTVSLRSERVGADQQVAAGKEIGISRVYDFALESGSYDTTLPDINQWDLSLFDFQTYTDFEVNESVTLTTPTYIQGKNSGASAFLRYDVSAGTAFTAYDVKGEFFIGEKLEFNGVANNSRTATDITNFEISDVKSVFGIVGAASTFSADLIPSVRTTIGIASFTAASGGVSTVTTPSGGFPGIVTTGNLIQYSDPTNDTPSLAEVTTVNTNSLIVSAVENVPGFRIGDLPSADLSVTDLAVVESKTQTIPQSGNTSDNFSLYSVFPKKNISNVDLTSCTLTIRKQFTVNITGGETTPINADTNEVFLAFDEERYTLIRSDGTTEELTQDRFVFTNGNTTLQIIGLTGTNDNGALLITTLEKGKVTNKVKTYNVSQSLLIDKSSAVGSGVGGTTLNDGLTYGDFPFGTRVQDNVISLNVPDVVRIYGVFESNDTTDPETPSMTTASLDGPTSTTNDLIVGDEVIGSISGARALYISKRSDTSVNFIYKNTSTFQRGEVLTFVDSGVSAIAANIDVGDKNITQNYKFSNGQKKSFYDIARLIRTSDAPIPQNKLKIFFSSGSYESGDTGDITVVNSYNNFDYTSEIPYVNGIRVTDIVDARPRVSNYTVSTGSRSPLEFFGRSFDGGQHSSKNIIASDETMVCDYDYFLGRIDSVFLTRDGIMTVKYGNPADLPTPPEPIPNALKISDIVLPPYLYDATNAKVEFISHKRYQMSDIAKLEKRIANLEYYTSLSQLESNAADQFVPDANGLNRFKSGIFVDNFTSLETQDPGLGIRNSIDRGEKSLRPSHYTTNVQLQVGNTTIAGIGTTTSTNSDSRFADILGTNIRRSGQVITLDYTEVNWLTQEFATRVESVTPFLVTFYEGSLFMEPDSDVWIDVNRMETNEVIMEGSFNAIAELVGAEVTTDEDGNRTGVTPIIWGSWETTGVNVDVDTSTSSRSSSSTSSRAGTEEEYHATGQDWGGQPGVPPSFTVEEETTTTETDMTTEVSVGLEQRREGVQITVNEQIDTESLGDAIVSREIIQFMRSRNIEFTSQGLKPYTRVYAFFDNVDVNKFCMPKLVEIQMTSGTFQITETVNGVMPTSEEQEEVNDNSSPNITFRVANPNHKFGPFNAPTDVFDANPYDRESGNIESDYSETSPIINIDTFSLASEESPEFSGWIAPGMILRGETSGAEATVTDVRLVSDGVGTLIGNYLVPPTSNPENPIFETGRSVMRLTASETDSRVNGTYSTAAEEIFYSQGDIDNVQETTLSLRNASVETDDSFEESRTISGSDSSTSTVSSETETNATGGYTDPLAQSFFVDDFNGIYLSSVDVYFFAVPEFSSTPCFIQIREVEFGVPNSKVLAFSEVFIDPKTIETSDDSTVATNIKFQAPVYLEGQREYALIIGSSNTEYAVWISRLGEPDVTTIDSESGQVIVSSQTLLGSLFKSQNASTWTPSQYEDLKFTLYRANFVNQGSVQFFNPDLPKDLELISKDNVQMESRTIKVGLGTTVQDSGLEDGNTVIQVNSGATGNFVGFAGSATGSLTVTNAGVGYTPSDASYYTFTGVAMTAVTGTGLNATADITISGGVAIGATIRGGGVGYRIGDIMTPIEVGNTGLGEGMRLSVSDIYGENEIYLTDVQGRFDTINELTYENSLGSTVTLNSSVGGAVVPQSPIRVDHDGLHMNVFFRNHGMHNLGNVVTLSNLMGEVKPTELTATYESTSTDSIQISSDTNFTEFEGVGVGASNPGYVKIGKEVIAYTGTTGTTLTGITRGIDNTNVENHAETNKVYKYEMNGVSLRRINRTHNLNDVVEDDPVTLDSYKVFIEMDQNGTDRTGSGAFPALQWTKTKSGGGSKGRSTYNVQYEMMIPNVNIMQPNGTNIESTLRTTSATSVSGSEPSFQDKGFSPVTIKQENYFESPRMVASKVNEDTYLDDLPGNKSMTLNMVLNTADSRITPCVDLNRVSAVLVTNRINQPVTDYANDFRVSNTVEDPNRFYYVTKNIILESPSTQLQVLLDGYINNDADIRLFYAVNQRSPLDETVFTPFPGYANINSSRPGVPLSASASDGSPDIKVPNTDIFTNQPAPGNFREYKFTIDQLPPFDSFRIKIICTSSNQAFIPQVRNFRATAFA